IWGNAGTDIILGGNGFDQLFGGGGDDLLIGEGGYNSLYGGEGDDILRGGSLLQNIAYGGDGNDTYLYGLEDGELLIFNGSEGAYGNGGRNTDFDVLEFLAGIRPEDVQVSRYDFELELRLHHAPSARISLLDYFGPASDAFGEGE